MTTPTPTTREPIDAGRVRKLPPHFAWADHRLRDVIGTLTLEETTLLFFLHLAADKNGCSFWSDAALAKKLRLREGLVVAARAGLIARGLVAYRYLHAEHLPAATRAMVWLVDHLSAWIHDWLAPAGAVEERWFIESEWASGAEGTELPW